jgi:hypothetical protein
MATFFGIFRFSRVFVLTDKSGLLKLEAASCRELGFKKRKFNLQSRKPMLLMSGTPEMSN